jgi:AcrR family transcriptional regulator
MQGMPRPDTDAPDRLQRAALELFAEKGFKATTVPEIARRAGLTTRSFFRHYADKREVLFRGDDEVPARITALMASRPPGLSFSDLILWGTQTIAREHIAPQRDYLLARRAIIQTDPGLRERDLRKQDDLAVTLAAALQAQGIDATTATVVGKITNAVSTIAVESWLDGPEDQPLTAYVNDAHRALTRAAGSAEPAFAS